MSTKSAIVILAALNFLFSRGSFCLAQEVPAEGSVIISEIMEEISSSGDEDSDPQIIADEMYYFIDHPLDLNLASENGLRQLHLLTEFQIYSLLEYIRVEGNLLSLYELRLVYGYDSELIRKLIPFITISPGNFHSKSYINEKKHFKQSLVVKAGFDGNQKAGFKKDSAGIALFTGANRTLMSRYEAGIRSFNFGFTLDQDAGESFSRGNSKIPPDFMSAFLEYKGNARINKIIIGDYRLSSAQGLILGGFGSRKNGQVLVSPETTGLKKYSSAGETDFFRGLAMSFQLGRINIDMFASRVNSDAVLKSGSADSTAGRYFNSLDLTGLHRSISEIARKDVVSLKSFGGHAQFTNRNLGWGFTYLNQEFNVDWKRSLTSYTHELIYMGTSIQNLGSDIKLSLGKASLFSELAIDSKARMAFMAGILVELHPLLRLSLVYRKYDPTYLGLKASGFGESQGTRNEEGIYLGLETYPWKYMKVELYADHYNFPFLRYNSTNPYSGNDFLLNLSFYPSKDFTVNMRFRYEKTRDRIKGLNPGIDRMENSMKGNYRLGLIYQLSKNLELKSRMEISYSQSQQQAIVKGYYSGHDIGIISNSRKQKLWLRYAIFDIPGWENRIYAYENDVAYSFSVPAISSKGTRFIIMAKTQIFRGLELNFRYAVSQFRGMRTWGSGEDLLRGEEDSYFTIMLKYKF